MASCLPLGSDISDLRFGIFCVLLFPVCNVLFSLSFVHVGPFRVVLQAFGRSSMLILKAIQGSIFWLTCFLLHGSRFIVVLFVLLLLILGM